uniref:ATP synthase F0 subunit 8 n=1 Tax=Pambolus sp. QL-2013 TaxID=1421597 RepID=A0A0A6ZL29_9HYME|nr:ATP synthase F0 subunit 8 [Pambolus sp. QL-2013]
MYMLYIIPQMCPMNWFFMSFIWNFFFVLLIIFMFYFYQIMMFDKINFKLNKFNYFKMLW